MVDAEDEALGVAGARVLVTVRAQETPFQETTTDEDGHFQLTHLPQAEVVILVEAPGYEPLHQVLTPSRRDQSVRLALLPADEDAEVLHIVEARPRPESASTTRLSPEVIAAAPRRNAEEVLRQVPGLVLVQHGSEGKGHQFFLRGFDAIHGSDLEVTVDGMPVNEWSNVHAQGYLDLALIQPEQIRGVEVTKGPFMLEQGAFAMAGTAAYQLGVPVAQRGWQAAYTAGTTSRHRLFAGYSPAEGDGQDFAGLSATHDEGYGQQRGLSRLTFNGRTHTLEPLTGGRLTLTGLASHARFELPGTLRNDEIQAGLVDFYDAYDHQAEGISTRALVGLGYTWQGDAHTLSLNAYGGYRELDLLENFTGFLLFPEDGDRRDQRQETWSTGLSGVYEGDWLPTLTFRAGAGLRADVFSQQEDNVGRDLEVIAQRRDLDATQALAHGLTGVTWVPAEAFRVDAGGRLDALFVHTRDQLDGGTEGEGQQAVISPRITTRWQAAEHWRVFLAWGRGFRPPEARAYTDFDVGWMGLGEDVASQGAPRVTTSNAFEAGFRWDPARTLSLQLSGFATFIERESLFDHVSGVNLELNGTRRLGGELVITTRPLPWLTLGADTTLADARFIESGNRVPLAPWLVSALRAQINRDDGLQAGLRVLHLAPRPLPNGATGATLVSVDATLGYRWRWLRAGLEIENLINRENREGEYHYASHWRPGQAASQLPVLHTTAGPPLNVRLTLGAVF